MMIFFSTGKTDLVLRFSLINKHFGLRQMIPVSIAPMGVGPNGAACFHATGYWKPAYVNLWQQHPIFENKCPLAQRRVVFSKFNEIVEKYHGCVLWSNLSWYIFAVAFGIFIITQISPHSYMYYEWYSTMIMNLFFFCGPFIVFVAIRYNLGIKFTAMLQEMRSYANTLEGSYGDLKFAVTSNARGPWRTEALQQSNFPT